MMQNLSVSEDAAEMRAINEQLVISGIREQEYAEKAHQAEQRAEAALEELQVLKEQYEYIADSLQRSRLFQPDEDAFSGLMVKTAYIIGGDEDLVGGDFWDTFAYDHGHVAFVLGDVMGHGLTSAVFTTELKHTMRAYIREHEQPGRILYHMNRFLYQSNRLYREGINTEGDDSPVCIALAVVSRETGEGVLSVAGMEPPILVRANSSVDPLEVMGVPLGVLPDAEYLQVNFQLEAGDTLVLSTDGISEARRGREFLEMEGLMRLASLGCGGTLKAMTDTILDGARKFGGGSLRDDASLVLVRRCATSPSLTKHPDLP